MTDITKPNTWIDVDANATTKLTYALQTNPAPLTVSVPGQPPELGALQFVITNQTNVAFEIAKVFFTLEVGTGGGSITPTISGIDTLVSDDIAWRITSPDGSGPGLAAYKLEPKTGNSVTVAAGASIVVEIYQMQTVLTPGTSTVIVSEHLLGVQQPGFANFNVTTFPDGFYFNGLIATVPQGSALVPVAEIANDGTSTVTLLWNSSVTQPSAFSVLYSNAANGQQQATPSEIGQWTSPALTTDTVFTVSVTVPMIGGQPMTAALSTTVSVRNPALIATSINAGTATVTGNAGVNGLLTAATASVTGAAGVLGKLTAATAEVTGAATVDGTAATGAATVNGNATVHGNISADSSLTAASAALAGTAGLNVTAAGSVGIGVASPLSKLHIQGDYQNTGAGGLRLDVSDAFNTFALSINPYADLNGNIGYQFQTTNAHFGNLTPMTISDSGSVGIGTNFPLAPLHVQPTPPMVGWGIQDQYTILGYHWTGDGPNSWTLALSDRHQGSFPNLSILAEGNIAALQMFAFSDERIKNIEGRSDGAADLATLLGIEVTDYRYKDFVGKGADAQKKAIAQQVETVFPQAVNKLTNVVPDIYEMASFCDGWIVVPNDLKKGERIRLIGEETDGVYEVLDAEEFRFHTEFDTTNDSVFVFGREVDDFRTIDYDALGALTISAMQQLKKEKDAEISSLRRRCDELEPLVNTLLERLKVLESKNGMTADTPASQAAVAGHQG